jgi:hypothetical protein
VCALKFENYWAKDSVILPRVRTCNSREIPRGDRYIRNGKGIQSHIALSAGVRAKTSMKRAL